MWTNALYINNLVPFENNFDRMCAAWTYVRQRFDWSHVACSSWVTLTGFYVLRVVQVVHRL